MSIKPVVIASKPQSVLFCFTIFERLPSTMVLCGPPLECQKLATCSSRRTVSVLGGSTTIRSAQKGRAFSFVMAGFPFSTAILSFMYKR